MQIVETSENRRTVTLSNGNKVHFDRSDPYGFWTVHYDKGPMPPQLADQSFTSFHKAYDAIKNYLDNKKKIENTENAPQPSGRHREQLSARAHN
jgi:beta-galactosidase beta subunit